VISSDCPPRQIPTIEERLHSRFEWGLIADIQPPDIETKVAILRKKAEVERVELPENVALFIASKVRTNIRELEGSLIRLIAYASLTGREIDLALAQETLRELLHTEEKPISIEMIQKFVADRYNVKLAELKAKNNAKAVAGPRQIAMYLTKTLTQASLPEIGKNFGGKHHSTVIHSIRKIEGQRKADPEFDRLINSFVQAFR
jgi:chromosomal replication initiator protein